MRVCTLLPRILLDIRLFSRGIIKKYASYCIIACVLTWWGKVDSNHRRHCQQIYSLSPLATREFPHTV